MLENFDPKTIEDEVVRQVVVYLMNELEKERAINREQAETIQRETRRDQPSKGRTGEAEDQGEQSEYGSLIREAPSRKQASSKKEQTGETQD
jgi:hypothetical protein